MLERIRNWWGTPRTPHDGLVTEFPSSAQLDEYRKTYAVQLAAISTALQQGIPAGDPLLQDGNAKPWDKYWWSAVRRNLGLSGIESLADVDPAVYMQVKLELREDAMETYRLQRKILAMLDMDRFMEERDFGVYRSVLEKLVRELADEVAKVRENCTAIGLRLAAIESIPDLVHLSAEQRRYWEANTKSIRDLAGKLAQAAKELRNLLRDKEVIANTLNEMRQVNRSITGHWGSWQRRTRHGLLGSAAALLTLLFVVWHGERWPLFSIVPMSEWVVSNSWRLALAGIATYILVRVVLGARVDALRKSFELFDPDQKQSKGLMQFSQNECLKEFKSYFIDAKVKARVNRYKLQYYFTLLLPAVAIAALSAGFPFLTSSAHVIVKSGSGIPCAASYGKTVFTFPTYKVVQAQATGRMHLFPTDDIAEISEVGTRFKPCDWITASVDDSANLQPHIDALATAINALNIKVSGTPPRETPKPVVQVDYRRTIADLTTAVGKLSERQGDLQEQLSNTMQLLLTASNSNSAKLTQALEAQVTTLRAQVCLEGWATVKSSITGMSDKKRKELEARLKEKCGVDFEAALSGEATPTRFPQANSTISVNNASDTPQTDARADATPPPVATGSSADSTTP